MGRNCLVSLILLASVAASSAMAQTAPPMPGDLGAAASQAVQALSSAAQDKLLVKDMLGAPVTGPGGQPIGTVDNLVVLPGGRIVAALISTNDPKTGRLAVPFAAVKLSTSAKKLGVSLPMSLQELTGNKDVQALTKAVQGMTGGS